MPLLGLYAWSQYTIPSGIPAGNLTGDSNPNDPAAPKYIASKITWIGQTFTFTGGPPTQIDITDDDGLFQDAYVETGGAQVLAQDVTIGGVVYPAGSMVENEFSLLDAGGQEIYVVRINGQNVGFAYGTGEEPTSGDSFTAQQGLDGAPADNADGTSSSSEAYANIVCFAAGTLIDTPDGPRAVERLHAGDCVTTLDHGPQRILWARQNPCTLDGAPKEERPVLIAKGALGPNRPGADLVVSPQHRVLVGGAQLPGLFGAEALAPAKSLTGLPGIRYMQGKQAIVWVHFALATHQLVLSNGCLTESLLLGRMAINGLTETERRELRKIFGLPAMRRGGALNGPPARALLTVQTVRNTIRTFRDARSRTADGHPRTLTA